MRTAGDPVRNRVLNMTIDFHRTSSRYSPRRNTVSPIRSRGMSFIPKNVTSRPLQRGSPYLHYRNSQRQSFRNQAPHYNTIIGLSPAQERGTIELHAQEITEPLEVEERDIKTRSSARDAQLRMVFNKKHLKNGQNEEKKFTRLSINIGNPEQNLKNIFTVRPVKTSERFRGRALANQSRKKSGNKPAIVWKAPQVMTQKMEESQVYKRIRPWSTSRNWENRSSEIDGAI